MGSGSTPSGRVFTVAGPGATLPNPGGNARIDRYNQLVTAYPDATSFVPDPSQPLGWRPWRGNALPRYGGDQYNYQPDNYLVTPWQRFSAFATGDVKLGRRVRAFAELSWVGRESQQKLSPEPLDLVGDGLQLSASNRYNPFGVDLWNVRGRLIGLGNRSYTQRVDTLRAVIGLDGEAPVDVKALEGWRWSAAAVLGRTQGREAKRGYTRISALGAALGPSYDYGTPGQPDWGCGTGPGDRIAGCVPVNIFGREGQLTAAERAAITYEGVARGTNELLSYQVNADGDLFRLWGDRPASLALGYEYRFVRGRFDPDPVTRSGDASTDGAVESTRGSQDVHEGYAELALPVVAGLPALDLLELQAAARIFRYSGFDANWTWKLGARWRPIRDVTLRGTLSTAFRAPSVRELYFGSASLAGIVQDPCSGVDDMGEPVPVSPRCGPLAGNVEPFPVVTFEDHGNRSLSPETARVFTAGLVLEPRFARELTLTFDAYGVAIDRVIQSNGDPVGQCYPMAADARPQFCQYVERDPATHALTRVVTTPVNVGNERMWGLDLSVRYGVKSPLGRLGLRLEGTYLGQYDLVQPDGTVIHARGTYDLASYTPGAFLHPHLAGQRGDELAGGWARGRGGCPCGGWLQGVRGPGRQPPQPRHHGELRLLLRAQLRAPCPALGHLGRPGAVRARERRGPDRARSRRPEPARYAATPRLLERLLPVRPGLRLRGPVLLAPAHAPALRTAPGGPSGGPRGRRRRSAPVSGLGHVPVEVEARLGLEESLRQAVDNLVGAVVRLAARLGAEEAKPGRLVPIQDGERKRA